MLIDGNVNAQFGATGVGHRSTASDSTFSNQEVESWASDSQTEPVPLVLFP